MARPKFTKGVKYRSATSGKNERFAIGFTESGRVNLWHIVGDFVRLYSFNSVEGKYDKKTFWHEALCRELLKDLMSPKPSVEVTRFVVNGQVVFTTTDNGEDANIPRTPAPLTEEEAAIQLEKENGYLEDQRMFREDPAPLILYGKYPTYWKEYAWKLFPNKKSRQGINPGDKVVVMSEGKRCVVIVTRVEEAGDKEQPTQHVIRKVFPQLPRKKPEKDQEASESDSVQEG